MKGINSLGGPNAFSLEGNIMPEICLTFSGLIFSFVIVIEGSIIQFQVTVQFLF